MGINRRRRYFIDRKLQGRMILRSAAAVFLGGIIIMLIFSYLTSAKMTMSYIDAELLLERTPLALLPEIIYALLMGITLAGIVAGVMMLFASHRVSGPIYRVRKHIKEMLRGDLTGVVRFRKKDEIKELADIMNHLTGDLRKRVSAIKKCSDELQGAVRSLDEDVEDPELRGHVQRARDAARRLEEEIDFFRTDDNEQKDP